MDSTAAAKQQQRGISWRLAGLTLVWLLTTSADAQELFPATPIWQRTTLESIFFDVPELAEGTSRDEEDPRIETDRREFTQSTTVIKHGFLQVESGYTFFRHARGDANESAHTTPETLFRIGLGFATELRLSYNAAWEFSADETRRGSEDFRFGTKSRINDQHGIIPQTAGILKFSVPTGSNDWSTRHFEAGAELVYAWDVEDAFELYGSSGYSTNARGDYAFAPALDVRDRFGVFTQSIAVGRNFGEHIHGYAEFFGYFTHGFEHKEMNPVFFDLGSDYFVTDNFVIDARFGVGLNNDADDFFTGVGAGFRY